MMNINIIGRLQESLHKVRGIITQLFEDWDDDADRAHNIKRLAEWKNDTDNPDNLPMPTYPYHYGMLRAAVEIAHEYFDGDGDTPRTDVAVIIASALDTPPRNCDRFATADDAKKEFNYLWNFVWKYGGGVVDEQRYQREFERWLFDKEKGETNGR